MASRPLSHKHVVTAGALSTKWQPAADSPRPGTPAPFEFPFSIFEFRVSSMRSRFRRRMHPVLRHFVDAARRRLLMETEKLVQRPGALAGLIRFFDRLRHIGLRQDRRFAQLLSAGKLRGNR